jgi:hypothetical protein
MTTTAATTAMPAVAAATTTTLTTTAATAMAGPTHQQQRRQCCELAGDLGGAGRPPATGAAATAAASAAASSTSSSTPTATPTGHAARRLGPVRPATNYPTRYGPIFRKNYVAHSSDPGEPGSKMPAAPPEAEWRGKAKGLLQILYERGWAGPSLKTVNGKWAAGWGTTRKRNNKPTKAEIVAMQKKDNGPAHCRAGAQRTSRRLGGAVHRHAAVHAPRSSGRAVPAVSS